MSWCPPVDPRKITPFTSLSLLVPIEKLNTNNHMYDHTPHTITPFTSLSLLVPIEKLNTNNHMYGHTPHTITITTTAFTHTQQCIVIS
jgi:hypothetical protein